MRRVRTGFEPAPSSARSAERATKERRTSVKRVHPVSRQPSAVSRGGGGGSIAGGGSREPRPRCACPSCCYAFVSPLPPFFSSFGCAIVSPAVGGLLFGLRPKAEKKWRQGLHFGLRQQVGQAQRGRDFPTPAASDGATATATANG